MISATLNIPTHDRVLELFSYNKETGAFTNRKTGYTHSITPRRYKRLAIDGQSYGAHRIAWYYCTKEWPTMVIDHIDRDPGNNRIANLRHVSQSVNMKNKTVGKHRCRYRGVRYISRTKFSATVRFNDKKYYLGMFNTGYNAHIAYEEKLKELMGDDYVDVYAEDVDYTKYLKPSKPIRVDEFGMPL